MVTMLQMFAVVVLLQQAPPVFDEMFAKSPPPEIASARKISESDNLLKPCHGFTVVFEVTLVEQASRTQWSKIARQVSNLVRVNGHDHKNGLTGSGATNDVCVFELLWPEAVGGEVPLQSSDRALIAASCQIECKARACLFRQAGDYRLEFFFGDKTLEATVHVSAPTPAERPIVDKLSTLPILLFLVDPTDPQYATPENMAVLNSVLEPPSGYTSMLSMALGIAKGHQVRDRLWTELTTTEQRAELQERYDLLRASSTTEPLLTRLSALAASELAGVAGRLAVLTNDPDRRAEYLNVRDESLQQVAHCRLLPREQEFAKRLLGSTPDSEK